MVKGSSNFWDNLQGAMRARARGDGTGPAAIRQAADEIRREKEAQALRKHTLQWERKFRDGRSGDLKIDFKPEQGYTDIYYGGIGTPDGPGHGHIRVGIDGSETVVREPRVPGQPNGKKDATLLDDNTPDKRL